MKDRRHSFVYRGEARTCRVPCRAELSPSWLSCLVSVCAVDARQQIGQRQHHKEHLLNHQKLTDTHTINVRKQRGLALGRMIFFFQHHAGARNELLFPGKFLVPRLVQTRANAQQQKL